MAARFTASFDILPNAKPFSVVATSEGGAAVMNIDPVQRNWQATFTVPTAAARSGDFFCPSSFPCLIFPPVAQLAALLSQTRSSRWRAPILY
jgi:hypothetical protein